MGRRSVLAWLLPVAILERIGGRWRRLSPFAAFGIYVWIAYEIVGFVRLATHQMSADEVAALQDGVSPISSAALWPARILGEPGHALVWILLPFAVWALVVGASYAWMRMVREDSRSPQPSLPLTIGFSAAGAFAYAHWTVEMLEFFGRTVAPWTTTVPLGAGIQIGWLMATLVVPLIFMIGILREAAGTVERHRATVARS